MKIKLAVILVILILLTGCAGEMKETNEYHSEPNDPVTSQSSVEPAESNDSFPNVQFNGEYSVQVLSTERDGMIIYGEAYIPDTNQEKLPIVIMSHGFNSNYASQKKYASALAKAGIASYVFDFCGGSVNSKSDGDMLDMSILTEMEDLNTVIDFVQTLDFVDTENIFLMGRSMGGAVSALVAAQRADDIQGLMLIYPAFIIPDMLIELFESEGEVKEQAPVLGATMGRKSYEDAMKLDIYNDIQGYSEDVLIIHGDRDGIVPISYSERAVEVYASAKLVVLKGAGHGFSSRDTDRSIAEMLEYIKQRVK